MDSLSLTLLIISILCSAGRNIFSKYISSASFGEKLFFLSQATIFSVGCGISFIFGKVSFSVASVTVIYALIYGALLISAQWCYTVALKHGKTGICSTVYSLGFIIPTLSGAIFWEEGLSVINAVGILIVIPTIILSGKRKGSSSENIKLGAYLVPLLAAMLSSGGLGIMQKLQQRSAYPEQKDTFIFISFAFAAIISLAGVLIGSNPQNNGDGEKKKGFSPSLIFAACVGVCFVVCNILNTTLAGRLPSALLFPLLNIGTIFLSMLLGILFFKDKLSKNDGAILLLGCAAILLISI